VLAVANPAAVCVPNTVNLTAASVTAGSSGGTITYWQNAQCTVPLVSPSAVGTSGTYFILSSTASTPVCTEVVPVTVQINTGPVADFTATPTVLSNMNPYSVMQNTSIGAVSYLWDFGDNSMASTLENPDHYFPYSDSGTYLITLIAMDQNSCVDTAYASVQVSEELIFYVPNTFTPDHDSFNETFLPIFTSGYDPYNYTLLIFDRWGEVVFESHNAEVGWKGTYGPDNIVVQDDTYTWKISFKLKMNNQVKTIVGHVNVLK
jgi:trimeric autotransporter adhesin